MSEQLCPWHCCRQPPLIIMESPIKVGHTNASDARNKITHRPMRPKPLIPILIDMVGGVDIDRWSYGFRCDPMTMIWWAKAAEPPQPSSFLTISRSRPQNLLRWASPMHWRGLRHHLARVAEREGRKSKDTQKFSPLAKANLFILSLEKQRTTDWRIRCWT